MQVTPGSAIAYNGIPVTFYISSGVKAYHVTSSNTSIINVPYNISGDSLTINPSNVEEDTDVTLTFMDSNGSTQLVPVTVKPAPLNNNFTITPVLDTCGTNVCSGQQATASVIMKIGTEIQVGKKVQFDVIDKSAFKFINSDGILVDIIEATTDQTGKATVRLVANAGVPTQYAVIRATDISGGSYVQTVFTIVQTTDGSAVLSVTPDTHTITAYYNTGCSSGLKSTFIIHGGTPPYTVQSTSTDVATVSPTTVLTDGAGFITNTTGTVCGEVIIDIKDATGLVTKATLKNEIGTNDPADPPPPALAVTPGAISSLNCSASRSYIITGGASTTYSAVITGTSAALPTVATSTLTIPALGGGTSGSVLVTDGTSVVTMPFTCP